MCCWRGFKQQVIECWQQLLYWVELASTGGSNIELLDTLEFFWDSLPDADKLSTAERRRLAHAIKDRLKHEVLQFYSQELHYKEVIHRRQLFKAQLHLQAPADLRQQAMRTMSDTARQQSMLLPSPPQAAMADGCDFLYPQLALRNQQHVLESSLEQQQRSPSRQLKCQQQYRQRWQVPAGSSSATKSTNVQADHVAIDIAPTINRIERSSGSNSTARELKGRAAAARQDASELLEPLLPPPESPFAAQQIQQLQQWWLNGEQDEQQLEKQQQLQQQVAGPVPQSPFATQQLQQVQSWQQQSQQFAGVHAQNRSQQQVIGSAPAAIAAALASPRVAAEEAFYSSGFCLSDQGACSCNSSSNDAASSGSDQHCADGPGCCKLTTKPWPAAGSSIPAKHGHAHGSRHVSA